MKTFLAVQIMTTILYTMDQVIIFIEEVVREQPTAAQKITRLFVAVLLDNIMKQQALVSIIQLELK